MKKNLCKIMTLALVVVMMLCTTAFAAEISSAAGEGNEIVVTVTGLATGDECTLLVVDQGTALSDVSTNVDSIYYVDQVTSENGVATFSLTVETGKNVDIYSGYSSMGTESPLEILGKVEDNIVYGDVNGDGKVNNADKMLLTRYVAKWDNINIDEKAADVNVDSKVNNADKMILTRHIAKWEGYETLPYKK